MCRLADGKLSKTQGRPRCKIVHILFADTTKCFDEIREAIIAQQPIVVVKGSKLCDAFIESKQEKKDEKKDAAQEGKKTGLSYEEAEFQDIITDKDAHLYPVDSLNSEEIAQLLHFLLTYTPYQKLVKEDPKIAE